MRIRKKEADEKRGTCTGEEWAIKGLGEERGEKKNRGESSDRVVNTREWMHSLDEKKAHIEEATMSLGLATEGRQNPRGIDLDTRVAGVRLREDGNTKEMSQITEMSLGKI